MDSFLFLLLFVQSSGEAVSVFVFDVKSSSDTVVSFPCFINYFWIILFKSNVYNKVLYFRNTIKL